MRLSKGVEWAAHCCLLLAWLADDGVGAVPTTRLAAAFELPPAYLNKRLQALSRAGILVSVAGVGGGFRLGRPLAEITLMDVVAAVEGPDEVFVCSEIRQYGMGADRPPADFRHPCGIAIAMRRAELAWRTELASQTLADMNRDVPDGAAPHARRWYAASAH